MAPISTSKFVFIALIGATLAGCANSPVYTETPALITTPPAPLKPDRKAAFVTKTPLAVVTNKYAAKIKGASYGLASFYEHDLETASGEKFDPHKMTAAHPTLPFGTRLRVTDVTTGRFVTVRINDRGPFVPGRIVDVSYTAAEKLGIIERGVAMVKLDVVP